ncbi:MAG: methyltransferase domain-containing protein [Candidatus Shapirobacteria bacterium]|jgi:2-polyprenyl-3-methyl-5-hydroxy-6-metoxy-1,4-benzoquinol methylase
MEKTFEAFYQKYGEYQIWFNQLNLESPSVAYAWRKTKKYIEGDVIEFIKKSSPDRPLTIGDFGCGNGALLLRLARMAKEINKNITFWGYDLSEEFVEYGNRAAKFKEVDKIKFAKKNIEHDRLDQKFDLIILSEVLEHVANPEEVLENISRSLNGGGRLVVSTPNRNNWVKHAGRWLKTMATREEDKEAKVLFTEEEKRQKMGEEEQHVKLFELDELCQLIRNKGFRIARTYRSSLVFGGAFLDNHPMFLGLTIVLDRFMDMFPIPKMGWDNIIVAEKISL